MIRLAYLSTLRGALASILFVWAGSSRAADIQWDNGAGNNDWANPVNWAGDELPASVDNPKINLGGANRAIYSSGTNTYNLIRVGDLASGAELDVTGGSLSSSSTSPTRIATGGRTATLNQSGGRVSFGGYMQVGLDANSIGNINLSGGKLISARDSTIGGIPRVSLVLGEGDNAQGNFVLSGGAEFRTRTGILLGDPTTTGSGRFEIRGAGVANIGIENAADDGFWAQSPGCTLAAIVDGDVLGTIYVDKVNATPGTPSSDGNTYDDGNVIFAPGSLLEVGFAGTPAASTKSWDVMRWDGTLTDGGLAFAPTVTGTNWSFAFVDTDGLNGPDTLRITYTTNGRPVPPTDFVKVPGDKQVALSWQPSSGATSYTIRAGTNSGGPYAITNTAAATSYTTTGLVNGTIYYFVVTASNARGEGAFSSEVSAKPLHSGFVHPGGMHTQTDFDRMRAKVIAGAQPWLDGWNRLIANPHAQLSWTPNAQPVVCRSGGSYCVNTYGVANYSVLYNDVAAAYQCALRYHVTGDTRYAEKAVQILNAWGSTLKLVDGDSDRFLASGIYGYQLANAGEMMRNYGGWSAADFAQFQSMMLEVFYPLNHDFLVNHNNACISHYWANWDLCNMASIISIGVLCDDRAKFDEAVNYFKIGAGNGAIGKAVYYVHPGGLGQWQESGRDQGHATLGMALMGPLCEVAWNQGVDLYGYAGNRFLAGCEYVAKYNLANDVPYAPYNNCDNVDQEVISASGRGTLRACWEMIYNHYVNRMGLAAPYTAQFAALVRPEGGGGDYGPNSGGYDQLGFGTLTYTRDPSGVVPPAVPSEPTGLTASATACGLARLTWNASAGATGYNIMRSIVSGGPYTTLLALNVTATNYTDTTAINGATYYYAVSALNAGGESAPSAEAGLSLPASALPAGWSSVDVGNVGLAGSANFCGDTFTVLGAGSDIGGTADSLRFAFTTLTNNGEMVARWASAQPGGAADKVGLMMRETTAPDSRMVALLYDDNSGFNRVRMPLRASTGASVTYPGADGPAGTSVPLWLRLGRTNDAFTGSISTDGTNWTLVAMASLPGTPATLLAGMAVCSRVTNSLDVSTFDHVCVSGVWPPPVSTVSPPIEATFANNLLQLSWPATHLGWRLEAQTNQPGVGLGTNWLSVAGSATTNSLVFPITSTNGDVFFRLVFP